MGLFGALLGPLMVFVPNYLAYRVNLAGAHSDEERHGIKVLYKKLAVITLGLFIPIAAVVLWLTRNQTDRSYLSGLFATILVMIFMPTILVMAIASTRKSREYYRRILAEEYAGVFPKPAWEYRTRTELFGLPLIHIRAGDRFSALKKPVKAWIAVGESAIGGLFAMGAFTIAPVSIGGFSIGILSLGGLRVGVFALGGIALGVWPLFGGLTVGWQALAVALPLDGMPRWGILRWHTITRLAILLMPRRPTTKLPDNSSNQTGFSIAHNSSINIGYG